VRRNQHLRAELLRLHECAAGKRLPGNACGETQVVFDSRAGTRLAAERPAVDNHDAQSLGRGVHRGGKARRPRAHDSDVVELGMAGRAEHAETTGDRVLGRIDEDRSVGTHRERVVGSDPVLLEQRCRGAVEVGVERLVRLEVAREERLQPDKMGRSSGTDEHGAARTGLEQPRATQDERAHDPLAQVRFRDDQRAQLFGRHQHGLAIVFGVGIHERMAPRELRDFARELAAALRHDWNAVAHPVALADGDASLDDQEHSRCRLAGGEQARATREPHHATESLDPLDLAVGQHGKHLVAARDDIGVRGVHAE
jgi:hypothetical protein